MEVKERWSKAEQDWQHLEAKLKVMASESREALEDISGAAGLLASEIREGYRHIRAQL